ncbi:MAG: hypothetical protein FWE31_03500 [Firmicutes bacterium]|nr:hypothetical protein [Bacillota bacterium]
MEYINANLTPAMKEVLKYLSPGEAMDKARELLGILPMEKFEDSYIETAMSDLPEQDKNMLLQTLRYDITSHPFYDPQESILDLNAHLQPDKSDFA